MLVGLCNNDGVRFCIIRQPALNVVDVPLGHRHVHVSCGWPAEWRISRAPVVHLNLVLQSDDPGEHVEARHLVSGHAEAVAHGGLCKALELADCAGDARGRL